MFLKLQLEIIQLRARQQNVPALITSKSLHDPNNPTELTYSFQ